MQDSETIRILIQGGTVTISLALIGLVYYFAKIASNHLSHTNKILLKMARAIEKLSITLDTIDKKNNRDKK